MPVKRRSGGSVFLVSQRSQRCLTGKLQALTTHKSACGACLSMVKCALGVLLESSRFAAHSARAPCISVCTAACAPRRRRQSAWASCAMAQKAARVGALAATARVETHSRKIDARWPKPLRTAVRTYEGGKVTPSEARARLRRGERSTTWWARARRCADDARLQGTMYSIQAREQTRRQWDAHVHLQAGIRAGATATLTRLRKSVPRSCEYT